MAKHPTRVGSGIQAKQREDLNFEGEFRLPAQSL